MYPGIGFVFTKIDKPSDILASLRYEIEWLSMLKFLCILGSCLGNNMQPIIVIPFASEVHGKEYYVGIYDMLHRYISRYGVEIHRDIIVESSDAERVGRKYQYFLPIALVLTGGVSKLIESFIDSGGFERIIILSHSEHNSLASAISAKNKAERKGITSLVYHCSDINSIDCIMTIDKMFKVAKTVSSLIGMKTGVIVDRDTKNETEELFESKFNATIHIKTLEQIISDIANIDQVNVNEAKKHIVKTINLELSDEYLETIARLYLALKNFVQSEGLDSITMDCFPFIQRYNTTPCIPISILNAEGIIAGCEADLPSLIGLSISRYLTGKSGWIANIIDAYSSKCILAHCTIALDIAKNIKIVQHFETKNPFAVIGEYTSDTVTIFSLDRDFTIATVGLAKVIASGDLGLTTCCSQMVLEFMHPIDFLPDVAPNNHHIIIPGDYRKELMAILYMLGLDVVDYREYWVS